MTLLHLRPHVAVHTVAARRCQSKGRQGHHEGPTEERSHAAPFPYLAARTSDERRTRCCVTDRTARSRDQFHVRQSSFSETHRLARSCFSTECRLASSM